MKKYTFELPDELEYFAITTVYRNKKTQKTTMDISGFVTDQKRLNLKMVIDGEIGEAKSTNFVEKNGCVVNGKKKEVVEVEK